MVILTHIVFWLIALVLPRQTKMGSIVNSHDVLIFQLFFFFGKKFGVNSD